MHSQRRWDYGSRKRLRRLRLRGNWPETYPLLIAIGAIVLLLLCQALFTSQPS